MASNANTVDEIELQNLGAPVGNPEAQEGGNSSTIPQEISQANSETGERAVPLQSATSGTAEGVDVAGDEAGAAQPLLSAGIVSAPAEQNKQNEQNGQNEKSCWELCTETIQNGVNFIFIPQEEKKTEPPSSFSMFLIFFGMILYVWDIASDITLAVDYYQRGRENFFRLTLIFIIVPTVFVTIVNIILFLGEDKKMKISVERWIFRIFFAFSGPLIRDVEAFIFGIKCRNANATKVEAHKETFNKLGAQAGALKLFETFLEAAPQATLNIYVLMADSKVDKPASVWQIVSLCSSIAALGWSIASFNRRSMDDAGNPRNIAYIGSAIDTLGNVCIFLARAMAFVLFTSVCPTIAMVCLCVSNWIVMTVFACILKKFVNNFSFDEESFEQLFLIVGVGWLYCFVFHDFSELENPRKANLLYYTVSFVMNTFMLFSWLYYSNTIEDSAGWDVRTSWLFIGGNYLLFFVGLFFLVMYQFKYHPTGGLVPELISERQVSRPAQLTDRVGHSRGEINGLLDLTMSQVYSVKAELNSIHKTLDFFITEINNPTVYKSIGSLREVGVWIIVELRKFVQILQNIDPSFNSGQQREELQPHQIQQNVHRNPSDLMADEGVAAAPNEVAQDTLPGLSFDLTITQIQVLKGKIKTITDTLEIVWNIRTLENQNETYQARARPILQGTGNGVLRQIEELHEIITGFQNNPLQSGSNKVQSNSSIRREQAVAGGGRSVASANLVPGNETRAPSQSQPRAGPSRSSQTAVMKALFPGSSVTPDSSS